MFFFFFPFTLLWILELFPVESYWEKILLYKRQEEINVREDVYRGLAWSSFSAFFLPGVQKPWLPLTHL